MKSTKFIKWANVRETNKEQWLRRYAYIFGLSTYNMRLHMDKHNYTMCYDGGAVYISGSLGIITDNLNAES